MTRSFREADIGETLMRWLESEGFDVYPEAQVKSHDGRADIIAVKKPIVWVIECKTSLSLQLLDQAYAWCGKVHLVSAAIPYRGYRRSWAAYDYMRWRGIGLLMVDVFSKRWPVMERIAPRLNRSAHRFAADRILPQLHPDMKRYRPGGTTSDGYSTPWRRTMDMACEFIAKNPGVSVKEIVAGIQHHYASPAGARACLCDWLQKDKRVRAVHDGRRLAFYPATSVETRTPPHRNGEGL